MPVASLEERMSALEAEVAELKKRLKAEPQRAAVPWWERRFGAFRDDPLYDEAAERGARLRRTPDP